MKHFFLQIHITGNCNLRCKHCYINEHSVTMPLEDVKKVLAQFDELIKALEKQCKERIIAHIHMTGGEPFLHPNIKQILWLFIRNKTKYKIGIMSNGTVLTATNLLLLKFIRLKAFQVSIDGTEKTHDAIRGKGNFQKVINALDLFYKWKIPTRVSFTANKSNFREFSAIAEICRKHHVQTLWSDRYIPFEHNNGIEPIDSADMEEYAAILQRERNNPENKKCGLYVQNFRALQFLCSGDDPYYCHAAENTITIDESGNIYPCRRLPINCGNTHTDSISKVYFNNLVFKELRKYKTSGKCINCQHAKTCKGGERCFTYAITEKYDIPDPCCWL